MGPLCMLNLDLIGEWMDLGAQNFKIWK